jgi:hypothetical protein
MDSARVVVSVYCFGAARNSYGPKPTTGETDESYHHPRAVWTLSVSAIGNLSRIPTGTVAAGGFGAHRVGRNRTFGVTQCGVAV